VFNMAVMGMRLAQRVNGVSLLHGEVSRQMFSGLWPGFDTSEVPIGSVTNGVHTPTWVAPEVLFLLAGGTTPQDPPAPGGAARPPRPPWAPLAREWVVTGRVDGRLIRVPRGSGGFGYDPIFLPDGFGQTTAEMTAEAKDAISHRGRAFRALAPFITAAGQAA